MHYLMSKNIPVLEIESSSVLNSQLIPNSLKLENLEFNDVNGWICSRALPLSRSNADKIYQVMNMSRDHEELKLMYLTHALSINDNYWIADESELGKIKYEDISIFRNSFNKSLYLVALKGKVGFTITDKKLTSPEFTGQGNYTKCFLREKDDIYIYKKSSNIKMAHEIIAAHIAKILGLKTVDYELAEIDEIQCTKSKIVTDERVNWETAASLLERFNRGLEGNYKIPQDFALDIDREQYCNMAVFDAIVLNDDRHMNNWAFEYNADTNKLLGIAPSYDYNGTFEALKGSQSLLIFDGMKRTSVLRAGRIAVRDYGTTLKINDLWNWLNYTDPSKLPFSVPAIRNRILYITGNKPNMNDCY